MLSRPVLALLALVLLAVGAVYRLELDMVRTHRELAELARERQRLEGDIASLRASLAWLARPARLARLAAELDLVPAGADMLVAPGRLQRREELELAGRVFPVPLRSGHVARLRARPPVVPAAESGQRP